MIVFDPKTVQDSRLRFWPRSRFFGLDGDFTQRHFGGASFENHRIFSGGQSLGHFKRQFGCRHFDNRSADVRRRGGRFGRHPEQDRIGRGESVARNRDGFARSERSARGGKRYIRYQRVAALVPAVVLTATYQRHGADKHR